MLTPQDIQDVKFAKSMKGYDKDQVEEFLDTVYADYSTLYKENATLKGKMRVLVDKIEEYRSVDEQMRKAFYNAQVTAGDTIAKAEAEAEQIRSNARQDAETRANDIRLQIQAEEKRLETAKGECVNYINSMKELLDKNIRFLDILMEKSGGQVLEENAAFRAPRADEEKVSAIEKNIEQAIAVGEPVHINDEAEEAESLGDTVELDSKIEPVVRPHEEPVTEKAPEAAQPTKAVSDDSGRFVFTELKFGKGYKEEDED